MYAFLPVILIFLMAMGASVRYHRRFQEVLPAVIGCIITVLYIFYCMDLLLAGFILLIGMGIITSIILIYKGATRGWRDFFEPVFTPDILVWLLSVCILYLITKSNLAGLWDELRLWGAYPKILFYTDKLQLAEDSQLFHEMQAYFPGISLWAYFFEKSAIVFKESTLFFSYGVYAVSLLMAGCTKISWKDYDTIPVIILAICMVPTLCYNSSFDYANFYFSLFADPVLGLTLGCLIYLMTQKVYTDEFSYVRFALLLITLTILKSSGIAFAIIIITGTVVYERKEHSRTGSIHKSVGLFLACIFCRSIWQVLCRSVNASNPTNFQITALSDLSFLKTFISELVFRCVIRTDFNRLYEGYSFVAVYLVLTVIFLCIGKMSGRKKRAEYVVPYIVLNICVFVFLLGLYITCISGFQKNTPSFPRYTCTVLCAMTVFCFAVLMNNMHQMFRKSRGNRLVLVLILISVFVIFPFHSAKGYERGKEIVSQADQITENLMNKMEKNQVQKGANVFLICEGWGGEYVLYHHRIYFYALESYRVKNHATMTKLSVDSGLEEDIENRKQDFLNYLREEECSYVWVAGISKQFIVQYQEVFSDEITNESLWKVTERNVQLMMQLIK